MPTIALRRLAAQQLAGTSLASPAQMAAWMGAIQGQDYAGAKWSLGARLPGCTDADVEAAFADRSLVRTWAMRGTLQFVAAADLRWLLALLGPGVLRSNARRYRELGLDEGTLERGADLLAEALADGRERDRPALLAFLRERGVSTEGQRAPHLLQRASLEGRIVQVGARRSVPVFASVASLPTGRAPLPRAEALAELARRFYRARGPAALDDFVYWSGLPAADARAGLEGIRHELAREDAGGRTYWWLEAEDAGRPNEAAVHLLPGFDEFLLGYRERGASLDPAHKGRWTTGGGMFNPSIVVGGRVAGFWKRAIKRDRVEIAVDDVGLPAGARAALAHAAARYGEFLGLRAVLV